MGYPTLQLSMAEIEALERAVTIAYHNGGDRLDGQEYLMLNSMIDRWWAKYEPTPNPYTEDE